MKILKKNEDFEKKTVNFGEKNEKFVCLKV